MHLKIFSIYEKEKKNGRKNDYKFNGLEEPEKAYVSVAFVLTVKLA